MGYNVDFYPLLRTDMTVRDRRDCVTCGHQAAWHALDVGLKLVSKTAVICMLCSMNDPDKMLNACWEGNRT